jgi:hypothetical protein
MLDQLAERNKQEALQEKVKTAEMEMRLHSLQVGERSRVEVDAEAYTNNKKFDIEADGIRKIVAANVHQLEKQMATLGSPAGLVAYLIAEQYAEIVRSGQPSLPNLTQIMQCGSAGMA